MPQETCDVVVLGLGGMGSAAAYHAASRGARVIGLEQFEAVHARGSSHGDVRVIRKGYFEHPDYVPLLHRAYELWEQLEEAAGKKFLTYTGALMSGPPDADYMAALETCYRQNDLPHERLSGAEMRARFPRLRVPEEHSGFYDPLGAYLFVEQCVRAHLDAAAAAGAALHFNERVLSWAAVGDGVEVRTEQRTISAARLIVTAGPWAGAMLRDLGVPLTVLRKVQAWFQCPEPSAYRAPEFPIYLLDRPEGIVYGFPDYGGPGLKMAEHTGGTLVHDPTQLDRALHPVDLAPLERFIGDCLPGLRPDLARYSVCMYTCTPDMHFVLDQHPAHPQVAVACGFSGHGFKFATVVGEIMADLAINGGTAAPIDFLRLARFA